MSYICQCCEYETVRKLNYDRHLLSSKHLKKSLIIQNDGKKENPAILNQKLIGEINRMERKHTQEINKLKDRIEIQAQQILELKSRLNTQLI
jgi:hypothetical protein